MIVSNEPGYYKTGAYGIRIENLVAVKEAEIEGADRRYFEFETLTLAPIDLELHRCRPADRSREGLAQRLPRAACARSSAPQVDEATRAWLAEATRAI